MGMGVGLGELPNEEGFSRAISAERKDECLTLKIQEKSQEKKSKLSVEMRVRV
jgi:hypothetical protein